MTKDMIDTDDDFVLLEKEDIPLRSKVTNDRPPTYSPATDRIPNQNPPRANTPQLSLQNINESVNEVLVTIQPPEQPSYGLEHTPCDIVLVIDVSGSMNSVAEVPDSSGSNEKEISGWSILDLVKHASRTVLENLNKHDRLAIVTFATDARVVQGLVPMTETAKAETRLRIEELTVRDSTNLWAGLREGLNLFNEAPDIGNAQGMYVLTDGVPNHLNPAQGFRKKLTPMLEEIESVRGRAPIVSTFGFGYYLKSSLLRTIAEVGRGTYSFIPDAGMIGTVFVHAVANLFSTYATSAELVLECSNPAAMIQAPSYYEFSTDVHFNKTTLRLGNIQYGQSRDVIFKVNDATSADGIKATLRYQIPRKDPRTLTTKSRLSHPCTIPQSTVNYHLSRHDLCTFLSSLSTKSANGEHMALPLGQIAESRADLQSLISTIKKRLLEGTQGPYTTGLFALLADLESSDPTDQHSNGQITLALQTTLTPIQHSPTPSRSTSTSSTTSSVLSLPTSPNNHTPSPSPFAPTPIYQLRPHPHPFYTRWGQHYLPSILHAHTTQLPITFKDPGPLRYCASSPLFIKCRDELDDAFDKLPSPKASLSVASGQAVGRGYGGGKGRVQMSRFNRVGNPCFEGGGWVKCAGGDGEISYVRVEDVRPGDMLATGAGPRRVRGVVRTDIAVSGVPQELICVPAADTDDTIRSEDGNLWITPWHPILYKAVWVFPGEIEGVERKVITEGSVYSFVMERDERVDAHCVFVGGVACVTLGCGSLERDVDVRGHAFLGDWEGVTRSLEGLDVDEMGRRICGGVMKGRVTGRHGEDEIVCGFLRHDEIGTSQSAQVEMGDTIEMRARL